MLGVKRKAAIAVISAAALVLGGGWFIQWTKARSLPRIPLKGSGEFRVVRICYGGEGAHHLGQSSRQYVWFWDRLPGWVQRQVPQPSVGDSALVPFPDHMALSIYWGWIDPATGKASTGPSGDVVMTIDAGVQKNLGWPYPFNHNGEGYRQIFVDEPPRDSRKLHFRVPVEEEAVEFTIDNPAFGK